MWQWECVTTLNAAVNSINSLNSKGKFCHDNQLIFSTVINLSVNTQEGTTIIPGFPSLGPMNSYAKYMHCIYFTIHKELKTRLTF